MVDKQPKLAAVILAAGRSERFGVSNKLLMDLEGKPMLLRILDQVSDLGLAQTILVTGWEAEQIEDAVGSFAGQFHSNSEFEQGMGGSLASGIAALNSDIEGTFVCLADMPFIETATFLKMQSQFQSERDIIQPLYEGRKGHPVLFGRAYFDDMTQLSGDQGAKGVIQKNRKHLKEVAVDDPGILWDIDRLEDRFIGKPR